MGLIIELIFALFRQVMNMALDWAKIEIAAFYVGTIEKARAIFTVVLAGVFGIALFMCGFLIFHAALFFILPWSIFTKALIFLVLGAVYFLVPLLCILIMRSRRMWMKMSGADRMMDEFTGRK